MVNAELYECPYQLQSAWDRINQERSRLLEQSDWIVVDVDLPEQVRRRWIQYRNVVRICTKLADRPEHVVFPTPPTKVSKLAEGWKDDLLLDLEVQFLQDVEPSPSWNSFLQEWGRYGFSPIRSLVEALLYQHTGKELNEAIQRI
ncbi:MAG: phage tail assembly chaperone [Chroococcidiopsis sp.]